MLNLKLKKLCNIIKLIYNSINQYSRFLKNLLCSFEEDITILFQSLFVMEIYIILDQFIDIIISRIIKKKELTIQMYIKYQKQCAFSGTTTPTHKYKSSEDITQQNLEAQFSKFKFKEYGRMLSQKKLTLTTNNNNYCVKPNLLIKQQQKLKRQYQYGSIGLKSFQKLKQTPKIHENDQYNNNRKKYQNIPQKQSSTNINSNPQYQYDNWNKYKLSIFDYFSKKFQQKMTNLQLELHKNQQTIISLKLKLQKNTKQLQIKQKQIKQLKILNQQYLIKKIQNLDHKVYQLNKQIKNYNINQLINNLQNLIIKIYGGKIYSLKKLINNFINKNQNIINKLENNIKSINLQYNLINKKIINLIQQLQQLQELSTKDTILIANQRDLERSIEPQQFNNYYQFQDYCIESRQLQQSSSSDYFFYPTSAYQNQQLQSFMEIINNRKQILQCFRDSAGSLRYMDSGTYIFDKKGNIIQLNQESIQYLMSRKLIKMPLGL